MTLRPLAIAVAVGSMCLALSGCKSSWPREMKAMNSDEVGTALATNPEKKPTLFVLYASWCEPCHKELPLLSKLKNDYAPRGLRVMAISLDEDPDGFQEDVMKKHHPTFDLVRLTNEHEKLTPVLAKSGAHYDTHIPYVALFDGDGKVIEEWDAKKSPTAETLTAAIDKALAPKPQ